MRTLLGIFCLAAMLSPWRVAADPLPVAHPEFDIMVLLDSSGSVDAATWEDQRDFAQGLVNALTIGPATNIVGFGRYGTTAQLLLALEDSKPTITAFLAGLTQVNLGASCIPCALDLAAAEFAAHGRAGNSKVTIILTDGANNVAGDELAGAIAELQDISTVFAVGFATVSAATVNQIASDVDGVQTAFFSSPFVSNNSLLSGLILNLATLTLLQEQVPEPGVALIFIAGAAALLRRRGRTPSRQ